MDASPSQGHPIAEHFNEEQHMSNVEICGIKLCSMKTIHRKQQEMQLIFLLGTVRPHGKNINVHLLNSMREHLNGPFKMLTLPHHSA